MLTGNTLSTCEEVLRMHSICEQYQKQQQLAAARNYSRFATGSSSPDHVCVVAAEARNACLLNSP
jgi:hypothetical protein